MELCTPSLNLLTKEEDIEDGDTLTLKCQCDDPKKVLLVLTVKNTEYLIANTKKRTWKDTHVQYFSKNDKGYEPINPFAMPATGDYNMMQVYLMEEDSYSKISVRCMPKLCSGSVVEYATIVATDVSNMHVSESMTIPAVVELDAEHADKLTTQEAPSGTGHIYHIVSSQTRLVSYNLPTGIVLRDIR